MYFTHTSFKELAEQTNIDIEIITEELAEESSHHKKWLGLMFPSKYTRHWFLWNPYVGAYEFDHSHSGTTGAIKKGWSHKDKITESIIKRMDKLGIEYTSKSQRKYTVIQTRGGANIQFKGWMSESKVDQLERQYSISIIDWVNAFDGDRISCKIHRKVNERI